MKLTSDELHLCGGASGVHRGWRRVAEWSKEEEVWSHVWEGGMRGERGMNEGHGTWQGTHSRGESYGRAEDASPSVESFSSNAPLARNGGEESRQGVGGNPGPKVLEVRGSTLGC